jgi:glycosyltransferase involved in cell wall biosynthesis
MGAPMAPRISILIPCFNDGATLPETLASLDAAEPLEVLVVDDASTDAATVAYLDDLAASSGGPAVLRLEENVGLAQARMAGLAATTAPYVFPLDSDDLAVPEVLTVMADRLDADPAAAACVGDYEEFGDSDVRRTVPHSLDPFRIAYVNEYPVTSMFRRTALERAGGWIEPSRVAQGYEDWNLWMALAERGEKVVHAGPEHTIYRRRTHGSRMLSGSKRNHVALYRAMRAAHPDLFARLPEHRHATTLSPLRRRVYPVLYGGRPRFAAELKLRRLLDRAGVWALGR